jgi:hypothetical protein
VVSRTLQKFSSNNFPRQTGRASAGGARRRLTPADSEIGAIGFALKPAKMTALGPQIAHFPANDSFFQSRG